MLRKTMAKKNLATFEWSYLLETTIDSSIKNLLVGADSSVRFPE